ncbi:hypothetical protein BJX99DRAFT_163666 [Aspergillus californicus]
MALPSTEGMPLRTAPPSPQETLEYFSGRKIVLPECRVLLGDLISETPRPEIYETWGVFEGFIESATGFDHTPSGNIVKMRFQTRPIPASVTDSNGRYKGFYDECQALEACQESGATPDLLSQGILTQEASDICPGGYIAVIVMSRARGICVRDVVSNGMDSCHWEICNSGLREFTEYIRTRGLHIRTRGLLPSGLDLDHVFYDEGHRRVYVVGLSRFQVVPPTPQPSPPGDGAVVGSGVEQLSSLADAVRLDH